MDSIQIKLYDLFRKELNLPDAKAAAFVEAMEEVAEQSNRKDLNELSTKEDIYKFEQNTKDDIHKLELRIEQSKSDIYKAMFWTGLVQLVANLGGVLAIVRFMK